MSRTLLKYAFSLHEYTHADLADAHQEGAFDEAVKDVDLIEHTIATVHLGAVEPDEYIVPSVAGTLRILEAALTHGTSVKRVVYTSTCGAVRESLTTPKQFSEADWNERAVAEVRTRGREAGQLEKYQASKVLAERAAWEFVGKHEGKIPWDLVVCNPPWIFGPTLQPVSAPEQLNESMRIWYEAVIKGMDRSGVPLGKEWYSQYG